MHILAHCSLVRAVSDALFLLFYEQAAVVMGYQRKFVPKFICQLKPVNSCVVNAALQGCISHQHCPDTHGFHTINHQFC